MKLPLASAALSAGIFGPQRMGGKEAAVGTAAPDERHFELTEGVFAGGLVVVRGDEAELSVYGSGRPVVSSELGKLVAR